MKTNLKFISLLMAMMVVLTGCGGGDDDTSTPPSSVDPDDPSSSYTLSLSTMSLSFDGDGGQQTVTVTTNAAAWTAESNQSWCKVSQSGKTLQVSVSANSDSQQRTAIVTVKVTGTSVLQTISVTQANASGEYCRADIPAEFVFNYEALGVDFVLFTNIGSFQVTSSESWCKAEVVDIPNSTDMKQLKIDVDDYQKKNDQGVYINELPRKATVTIVGSTIFSHTITVVQNSHIYFAICTFLPPFVNGCLALSPEGDTKEVMVETNCYSWTPTTGADWLTVKRLDGSTLSVTSKARATDDNTVRMGSVYIECDSDPYRNITINVCDADSGIQGEDYDYDKPTEWD